MEFQEDFDNNIDMIPNETNDSGSNLDMFSDHSTSTGNESMEHEAHSISGPEKDPAETVDQDKGVNLENLPENG
jgi:hypothetical protein